MPTDPDPMQTAVRTPASLRFGEAVGLFLWGLAEASFFFLPPEMLLTWIAVQRRGRAAFWGVLATLAGALAGALLMYSWGSGTSLKVITAFMGALPDISRAMVRDALQALQTGGGAAAFGGIMQLLPSKLFSTLAPHAGLALSSYLAWFTLAQLLWLGLAAGVALLFGALWRRLLPGVSIFWPWLAFWTVYLALWFWRLPA